MWAVAAVAAVAVVLVGVVTPTEAIAVLRDLAPVMLFLASVSVLSVLAGRAGVFDVAAAAVARAARGRTPVLFALVAVLATVSTTVLSLDTTAVLLTPVVLTVCRRCGVPPLPFAVLVMWLANTASLTLPVSNLTTLLAQRSLDLGTGEYLRAVLPASVVAVLVSVGVLAVVFGRRLRGRHPAPAPVAAGDRVLLAAVLLGVSLSRREEGGEGGRIATLRLAAGAVPWRLVVVVAGLFVVVAAAGQLGLDDAVASALDRARAPGGVVGTAGVAGVAALTANLANNLPAYAALQPAVADDVPGTLAVLVGVNTGPLVLAWASLSNLLWHQQCRRAGLEVSWWWLGRLGLFGAVVVVAATALVLGATGPG